MAGIVNKVYSRKKEISTRTPSWVTELASYAHALGPVGTFQLPARHFLCLKGSTNKELLVDYHLRRFSGQSGWKVNETQLFASFQRKIYGSNGTPEKVVLFFRTEYQSEIRVPFLQSHL